MWEGKQLHVDKVSGIPMLDFVSGLWGRNDHEEEIKFLYESVINRHLYVLCVTA